MEVNFERSYSAFIGNAQPVGLQAPQAAKPQGGAQEGPQFSDLLRQTLEQGANGLTLSKHAQQRVQSRGIELSPALCSQLTNAVDRAGSKGIRDALILGGANAFIVNVPSRTIVTAMSGSEMQNGVYTNIDGAVLL